jgi:hypothetical protein
VGWCAYKGCSTLGRPFVILHSSATASPSLLLPQTGAETPQYLVELLGVRLYDKHDRPLPYGIATRVITFLCALSSMSLSTEGRTASRMMPTKCSIGSKGSALVMYIVTTY